MKEVFVADVGDGLCMAINTDSCDIIQIDWGSQQGGYKAYIGFQRIKENYCSPSIFILSHFHLDHYNGLLYASTIRKNFEPLKIKKVYYPRIPKFEDQKEAQKELITAFFTMNMRIFGDDTGVQEYDFLRTISKINSEEFKSKPLSKGEIIDVNGEIFEVLWPPKVINHAPKVVKNALKDFKKACNEDKKLRKIYESINEERIYKSYIEDKNYEPEKKIKIF